MSEDFKVQINAELDTSKVEQQIKDIEKKKIKLGTDNSALDSELQKLKNKNLKITLDANGAIQDANSLNNTLKKALNIGSSAAITAQAFRLIKAAINDAKSAIEDYNAAITDLRIVTNASQQQASSWLNTYNKMAQTLGATTSEVANAAVTWLRQGKTAEEANTLIKDSMMLSKIGMIDSEKAAENLTTAMKGYKVSVEDAVNIVDKLGKLDSTAAVTAGDLAVGMSKTAATANDFGVSMNTLLGYLSAVGEVSGDVSATGTFLKTMFSRMSDIKSGKLELIDEDGTTEKLSDVETTLSNVGINLRETVTEFNSFEDVLDSLAKKYQNLNSVQQAALAKAFSGVRQQNNFRILMANYDKAKEYSNIASDSTGAAEEKFNAYLDSIEAKSKTLQSTFESLANNTISSELVTSIIDATTAIITFIDKSNILKGTLTGLVAVGAIKMFAKLATGINNATIRFNDFNAALKMSKSVNLTNTQIEQLSILTTNLSKSQLKAVLSSKSLTKEQRLAILTNIGLSDAEAKTALSAMGLSVAEGTATTATFTLKGALKGLWATFLANPLVLVATAIAGVISVVATASQQANEAAQQATQQAFDGIQTIEDTFSDIDSYKNKIKELKDSLNDSNLSQSEATEKRKELLKIQEELISKYGQEKDAVDYITESIQGETNALNELQVVSAKDYLRNNRNKIKDVNDYFNNSETRNVAMNDNDLLSGRYNDYDEFMDIFLKFFNSSQYQYNGSDNRAYFTGTKDEIIAQYDDLRDKIQKYIDENPIDPNDNSDNAKFGRRTLQYLNEFLDNLSEARNQIVNDENYDDYKKIYDTAIESVVLTSNKYSEYYEKLIQKKKEYTEALASGNQDEITKTYTEMNNLFNEIFSLDFLDEDNVSGDSIKAWFADIQEQIYKQSKETPIIVDVKAELSDSPDGYANNIKKIVSEKGYYTGDLKSIIAKAALGEDLGNDQTLYDNIQGYVDLWNSVAESTGQATITTDDYIEVLERLGVVQNKVSENTESSFALSDDQTKELKSIYSDVDKLNKAYQDLFAKKLTTNDVAELVDLFPTLGEYVDWTDEKFGNLAEGIDKVIKERPTDLINQLESIDTTGMSEQGRKSIESVITALKQLKPELKDTKTLIEDIQAAIKGVSSSISTLIGFTKEISSDGALSLSSIDTILADDTYKSLRPYINDMDSMQVAIEELVAKQKDAYEDLYNAEMYENDYEAFKSAVDKKAELNSNLVTDTINEIDNEISQIEKAYNVDLTNWNNLTDDKKSLLANTNAELLANQRKTIDYFKDTYNVDLTNYKDFEAAKTAIKAAAETQKRNELLETARLEAENKYTQSELNDPLFGDIYRNSKNNFLYWSTNSNGAKKEIKQAGEEALKEAYSIFNAITIPDTDWEKMTANITGTGSSSSSSSTKNYIDWIERRLKKFAQTTKEVFAKVADYISFNNQNSQLRKAINAIRDEIAVNEQSYRDYMEEANKVGLDPYWQRLVQNGKRNISDIQDEQLREKISRYKELYDNAINCKNAVEDLRKTEKEYASQMLSNVEKYYSNRITYANADADYYNSLDTDNQYMSKNFDAIRKSYKSQISYTQSEHDNLLNTLNSLVSSGSIKYQSDEWYEWWDKIQKCNIEVRNLKKSIHDLANEELQNIQGFWDNRISSYDNTISYINTVSGDTTRKGSKNYNSLSSAYNSQISYTNKQISELQTRLNKAIKSGDIEKYSDKWYEWTGIIEQGKGKVAELQASIHQLAVEQFNDISTKNDNLLNSIEHQSSLIEESINQIEEKGYIASIKYYNALIDNERNNISQLSTKRNELYSSLQQAIKSGNIQKDSEEWHKMIQEINSVDLEIEKANTSVIKFGNSIRDIQWQIFDLLQDEISQITQESNFLVNLMKNDNLYVKEGQGAGQLTNKGLSTMGLHGVNYNVYMAQSSKYAEEILKINKQLAKDPYNQDLIKRREELLKLQQDMITSANDEKQAIISMVKEGIDLELNALKELIDKYNDALDSAKNLYDYQNNISDKTSEIASLRKQLLAYSNDTSEETKATIQKLQVSLSDAEKDLKETEYDKYISDQKELLNDLYDEYETIVNQRLDNVDSLISDMITNINDNASTIKQTLIDETENVGYQISSTMNNIWNNGTIPVLSEYNQNFLNASNNVVTAINSLTVSINNMIANLDKTASTTESVKSVTKKPTVTVKNPSTTNKTSTSSNTNKSNTTINTNKNSNTNNKSNTNNNKSNTNKSNTNKSNTSNSSTNKVKRTDKENYGVALAIWNGNYGWGNGSTRIKRLTAKGFDASKVQSIVNKMGNDGYVYSDTWSGKYYGIKDLSPYHYNKFKQGTHSVNRNQMAWTNESGNPEVIIRRSDGAILTPLVRDDMVLNGNATNNLFNMATDPNTFIKDNLFNNNQNTNTPNISNINNNSSINVENINFNLPNVKNYEEWFYAAQHDKRFEKMIQSMTTDRLSGGSSLKKYNV